MSEFKFNNSILSGLSTFSRNASIKHDDLGKVYGTIDEFYERYQKFQQKYISLLESGKINPSKVGKVNLDVLTAGGKIDLSVLDDVSATEMRRQYLEDIIRLPKAIANQAMGLPDVEIPSSNLYRKSVRYSIDFQGRQQAMHPAAVLLNRTIFNINTTKNGLDAFNPGVSNLPGIKTIRQGAEPINIAGKKVHTFDVETTGIFEGSEVRSMSMAENIDGNIKLLDEYNIVYKSKQLGGITVGGSEAMNDFLARSAPTAKIIEDSRGGVDFLDSSSKFVNKLLEADHISAHNAMFDIQMLLNTMTSKQGYADHEEAKTAVRNLTEKMKNTDDFVIDTLEQSRIYLSQGIDKMIQESPLDRTAEINKMKELLYSDEFLTRAKMPGKSAATASVEAIAMNTNLLSLIEKEAGGSGDEALKAQNLFKKLYQGTHVSDTDAILQSYVGKYISNGLRDEDDPFSLKVVDRQTRSSYSKLVRGAQSKIFRSSAITPTTNIADVKHLSNLVFDYVSGKGISNTDLLVTGQDLVDANVRLSGGGALGSEISDERLGSQGILGFDKKSGRRTFTIGETDSVFLDNESSNNYVGRILRESQEQATEAVSLVNNLGTRTEIGLINSSAEKIIDFGIDFGQASQIDEIHKVSDAIRTRATDTTSGVVSSENLLSSLGKTYKLLSAGTPFSFAIKGKANFSPGLNNATANTAIELAEAALTMGSPHIQMTNQSRVLSTIISQATSGTLEQAREHVLNLSIDAPTAEARDKFTQEAHHLRYAKHKDLISEYGVSHFTTQKKISLISESTPGAAADVVKERITLPAQILEQVIGKEAFEAGEFSLSVGKTFKEGVSADQLNLYFRTAGGSEGRNQSMKIAEGIYDHIMIDREPLKNANKATEAALAVEIQEAKAAIGGHEIVARQSFINGGESADIAEARAKSEIIETMAERIEKGGIGVGYAGKSESEEFVRLAKRSGTQIDNDFLLDQQRMKSAGMTGDYENIITTGSADRTVMEASTEAAADMDNAKRLIKEGRMGDISDAIGESPKTEAILRMRHKRRMMGMDNFDFLEQYIKNKGSIRSTILGMAAVGIGYYGYSKHKNNQMYDETLDDQPIEGYSAKVGMGESVPQRMQSRRRDPLVTAGVVGNLDRNKIGHYKMGNDKYNNLYSGA